jgi:signal transduction histidine kinase
MPSKPASTGMPTDTGVIPDHAATSPPDVRLRVARPGRSRALRFKVFKSLRKSAMDISEPALQTIVLQLQSGECSLAWSQRRELVQAIGESLCAGHTSESGLGLIRELASDAKWEVRRAVTDLLPLLPDHDFDRLAAQLSTDSNAYVRRSVERAVKLREVNQRAAARAKRSLDQVSEHFQSIELRHGKVAANKAMRMCERYSELLVGSMVHDLRSILTHLKLNCHSLITEVSDQSDTRAKRLGGRVRSDLEFLELAIEDMRAFTQPVPTERQAERLAVVVAEAVELARDNVRKVGFDPKPVVVQVQVAESIVVEIARHQIVMALANVLKNALEAFVVSGNALREGSIDIEAVLSGKQVSIVVLDNGQGMSDEEADTLRLLTPGRRNKTKKHSSGYGLPIAARNLAAHGGSLTLKSRENEGTAVTMALPLRSR